VNRISVVIPVLDDADMLARCLASLGAQSRPADEILVIDNGSTDESADVARRFGATVVAEVRPGIPAASARGFDEASGDIIARCDADSVLPVDWLARIDAALRRNPDAVAVTGRGRFYDMTPRGAALASVFYMRWYFFAMRVALGNNPVFGSNYAIRASVWRLISASVPRNDTELHDDIDVSYRLDPSDLVLIDPDLVVGISWRPFLSLTAMRRRLRRMHHTALVHGVTQLPPSRWTRRARARARSRREAVLRLP
jgi:glycosyltransferase involved in cell wall biosynthesis